MSILINQITIFMRTLNNLSFILYVVLFPFALGIPLMIWIVAKVVLNINEEIPTYKLLGEEILTVNNPIPLIIALILYLIVSIANAYGLLLLYRIIEKFKKFQLFQSDIISNLKQMGYIFSLGYLLVYFLKLSVNIEDFIFFKTTTNHLETIFIESPINGLIIGLFFLVLSKVFKIAKIQKEENIELKQENELTI